MALLTPSSRSVASTVTMLVPAEGGLNILNIFTCDIGVIDPRFQEVSGTEKEMTGIEKENSVYR